METLWDKIKGKVREGASAAVEKAEEIARISKAMLDIAGVKRNINRVFAQMGGRVYHLITTDQPGGISEDGEVVNLVERLKTLEQELKEKEEHLEQLRRGVEEPESPE